MQYNIQHIQIKLSYIIFFFNTLMMFKLDYTSGCSASGLAYLPCYVVFDYHYIFCLKFFSSTINGPNLVLYLTDYAVRNIYYF